MHRFTHAAAIFILAVVSLIGIVRAQSGSAVDTPPVPSHSGNAAGPNGPRMNNPSPPARGTSNPVNNREGNSPRRSFTGIVSDSFCGKHHYMLSGANDTECVRYCIAHQGTYALLADKLYKTNPRKCWMLWPGRKIGSAQESVETRDFGWFLIFGIYQAAAAVAV
jgi:hypothetical protein